MFPGFHEAVSDQPLPQEEQLLMASEELVSGPRLHITEAFQSEQPSEFAAAAKMESIEGQHLEEATAAISATLTCKFFSKVKLSLAISTTFEFSRQKLDTKLPENVVIN